MRDYELQTTNHGLRTTNYKPDDSPKDHCGVFGIYGHREAAKITYLGLYALQHRGEESAGIATSDGKQIHLHKGMGLVGEVFTEETMVRLPGRIAIGHTRYSTTGSSLPKNAQPLVVNYSRGVMALAHNGNLVNATQLKDQLETHGSIFQTTTDTEIVLHMMAHPGYSNREQALAETMKKLEGAYSFVFLTENELMGVRDPLGFRPLCLGKLNNSYVLASETCALDLIHAKFIREIEPGELIAIDEKGVRSLFPMGKSNQRAHCIFEHVYFARPDSHIFGENVQVVREKLGRRLAVEHPALADLVIPIPDSGNAAALGYSHESGIPFAHGLIRNHYIGRTFIQPSQKIRDLNVKVKFNPLKDVIRGKRLVVVDDSIVRGTTCRNRVRSLREAGAKEIHLRISCPPIRHPCFYGIDFPTHKELIAQTHAIEEIRKFVKVETLGYLSLEGMLSCVSAPQEYCTACYSGEYRTKVPAEGDKYALERTHGEGGVAEKT